MSILAIALVLSAAFFDALLHCVLRGHGNSMAIALLTAVLGGVYGLPLLGLAGPPDPASWPWLAISVGLGCLYWVVLGAAYRLAGVAVVMPLTRGISILITTAAAWALLDEVPGRWTGLTIFCIVLGLALLGLVPSGARMSARSLLLTLVLAAIISGYTMVDAIGVRLAGDPLAYGAALYAGNGLCLGIYAAVVYRPRLRPLDLRTLGRGAVAAALSLASYLPLLAALALAPVAPVAALAETSIVFAVVIAVIWLREPARSHQMLGAGLITLGIVAMRLSA